MTIDANAPLYSPDWSEDWFWSKLQRLLRPYVRHLVYCANVPIWKGQEYEVTEDLIQTTLLKTLTYLSACRANGTAIGSLEHLSLVIAKHCFFDMRRRDLRWRRLPQSASDSSEQINVE